MIRHLRQSGALRDVNLIFAGWNLYAIAIDHQWSGPALPCLLGQALLVWWTR